MRLTFRAKTVIGIAAIEAVMLLILVASSLTQLRDTANAQLAERAVTTATLFTTLAKDAVLATDLASLETFVDEMMLTADIVYVRVSGFGNVLASRGELPGADRADDQPGDTLDDGVFDASDTISESGHVYGRVELGLSNATIAAVMNQASKTQMTIALLEIALVGVFSLVLGTYLTRQLDNLRYGVRALTNGDLGVQLTQRGNDELAELASGFNIMSTQLRASESGLRREVERSQRIADDLREQEAALRYHQENLERLVSERTAELERMAESHAAFIRQANAPAFAICPAGNLLSWNDKAGALTGIARREAIGKPYSEILALRDGDIAGLLDMAAAEQEASAECEIRVMSADRRPLLWLMGVTVHRDAEGQIASYTFVGYDITERQQMQAQLVQSSKLATLGEMATGIAHEINQPLLIISMAIENCLRKLSRGRLTNEIARSKLGVVKEQVGRASEIVHHMRVFGRREDGDHVPFDAHDALRKAVQLVSEQLRLSEIELEIDVDAGVDARCAGARIQFEQVLINLLNNARDAFRETGVERKWIRIRLEATPDDGLRLTVTDNAGGIPATAIERVFEPFFTTKEAGQGTGLGLSVSYGIIREMRGTLTVSNTPHGACFVIALPRPEAREMAA
ncbi:MAG: ATP-binding protein [Pseudomonadota bacterium]